MCGSLLFKILVYINSAIDGPKDPWPSVLSLPGAQGGFVGDPTLLACDNIIILVCKLKNLIKIDNRIKNINSEF